MNIHHPKGCCRLINIPQHLPEECFGFCVTLTVKAVGHESPVRY